MMSSSVSEPLIGLGAWAVARPPMLASVMIVKPTPVARPGLRLKARMNTLRLIRCL